MIKSLKKKQGGFTLIELMVVIVIIGILVAIALPNFIGAQDRAKISSVKANQHTFQTIVETYAVDWGGVYAGTTIILSSEAHASGRAYWKEFVNPFTSKSGAGSSYTDSAFGTISTGDGSSSATSSNAGLVIYDPQTVGNTTTRYYVYGLDKSGLAIRDKGQNFYLTNS